MSHLTMILNLKDDLTNNGITCPVEQSKYVEGVMTRAFASYIALPTSDTEARNEHIWYMLDMWNSITPLNGQAINLGAFRLFNSPQIALLETGLPYVDLDVYLTYSSEAAMCLFKYLKDEIITKRKD